jgi:hypothetical protein
MDMYIVNFETTIIKMIESDIFTPVCLYVILEQNFQRSQLSLYSEHSKHLQSQTETSVMLLMWDRSWIWG